MPDGAIFADTEGEPKYVYEWLDWLETKLPFPVYRVSAGDLEHDIFNNDGHVGQPPFYTKSRNYSAKDLDDWAASRMLISEIKFGAHTGILRRKCTAEYKAAPLDRKMRELAGLSPGQRSDGIVVTRYVGISLDEAHRMKDSGNKWSINRYPLIEKRMSRADCLLWMKRNGYPEPKKSACYFCPYHSNETWRDMKDNHPIEWQRAVELDAKIRNAIPGVKDEVYIHSDCVPLDQVDLRNASDHGQTDMFGNECEGMCGV